MNNIIMEQEINNLLKLSCQPSDQVYVVGGAVRDFWLGLPSRDYDIVIKGDVLSVSKLFANSTGSDFYTMDEEHKVVRVLYKHKNLIFDFSELRGGCLEDDLRERDFTMNAMAVGLEKPDEIIDPLNGRKDLRCKNLTTCTASSLTDDPIRLLRAVRFSCQFKLGISEELSKRIQESAGLINNSSKERKRDELFHIFDLENPSHALLMMEQFGLVEFILPELKDLKGVEQSQPHTMDVWSHTITSLQWGEKILKLLKQAPIAEDYPAFKIYAALESYIPRLQTVLDRTVQEGRNRMSLLKMGIVLHDIAKPETRTLGEDGRYHFYGHHINGMENLAQIGKNLALSNNEIDYLCILVRNHMLIHWLCKEGQHLTKRAIYRYFSRTHEYGIDLCILSLADMLAKSNTGIMEEKLQCELAAIHELLAAWFSDYDRIIDPPLLLNGHDVMFLLEIGSDPEVGEVLNALKEAQAVGEITDKLDAEAFVLEFYSQLKKNKEEKQ